MPNGFEWPEFRPGDRVMVRRPSEEAPPDICGCRPVDQWDAVEAAPIEGVIVDPEVTVRGECAVCGAADIFSGILVECGCCDKRGVMDAINLELLEAADD